MARQAFETLTWGYDGAARGRRTEGWRAPGSSADTEIGVAGALLRDRMRDLVRNHPHAAKAVAVLVNNIIGAGIMPRAASGDDTLDRKVDALFERWTAECDADGQLDFYGLQTLICREMVEAGEVLVRRRLRRSSDGLPVPLQLQVLEADFLDATKSGVLGAGRLLQGIEFDPVGKRRAYWLHAEHPGDAYGALQNGLQKHVTHNEALRLLDGLVQLSVLDRDLAAPPASPADGDRYIVASDATGDWAGWDLNVALWTDGAWLRLPPRTGWRAWVEDEGVLLVYDGSGWVGTTPASLQNLALLGLGTTADASNPFSAKLNAALWTAKTVAEGGTGDLFYTMNKEAAGDDLGLTLQTGFVTKALVGLFGSDRFRLAVSADGSTFFDGLSVDNTTGIVDQPRLPRFKAWTNYDNYVGVGAWTKIGLNNTDYNDQGAFDAANNHFVAPVDGTYLFGATLLYKINASATARMRGRLVLNGTTEIRGSLGEISATHVSLATAIWLQTMVPLIAGDTVELQGYFRVADGYFAADHTSFWGCKVG